MGDIAMIPTRDVTIQSISSMPEQNYRKVAFFVQSLTKADENATQDEVAALTKKFNQKYAQAFRALGQ